MSELSRRLSLGADVRKKSPRPLGIFASWRLQAYGYTIAALYARLGETDKALDWLEEGYAVHDPYLFFWISVLPEYDSLRSQPRYQKLLRALDLPPGS